MKTMFFAAALTLAALPAFAQEGSGDPFVLGTPGTTSYVTTQTADVGSSAYPNVIGRPGSNLSMLAGDILPVTGSEGPVQTANSLPVGFTNGTVTYAGARPVRPATFSSLFAARK